MIRDSSGISVSAQARRVAGAVEALVVVQHPLGLDRQLSGDEDAVPDADVLAHLLPLVVGERRRLVQDRIRHADLADVVQEAGEPEPLDALAVEAEAGADRDAELGDGLGVAARPDRLRVDSPRERRGERLLMVRRRIVAGLRRRSRDRGGR